jgi:hypothetical protein
MLVNVHVVMWTPWWGKWYIKLINNSELNDEKYVK